MRSAGVKLATGLGMLASIIAVAYALLFCVGAVGIAIAGLWEPASRTWPLLVGAPVTLLVAGMALRHRRAAGARKGWLSPLALGWAPAAAMGMAAAAYWMIAALADQR